MKPAAPEKEETASKVVLAKRADPSEHRDVKGPEGIKIKDFGGDGD